jgi:hypothetical protein
MPQSIFHSSLYNSSREHLRVHGSISARLRETAAQCRLRVIESNLSLAFTLCALAETQILYGRRDEALQCVEKVQQHVKTIRIRLDEPDHLPKTAISDIREQLSQLDKRTAEIESSLRQK